jgi:hypothetical protein
LSRSLATLFEEKLCHIQKREDVLSLQVVRRLFQRTALEQLQDCTEEDWHKPVKVTFIGEEGIDAGGLLREFFTLVFDNMQVFNSNGCFCVDSQFLQDRRYFIIGKVTALALIHGHPGPHALNPVLSKYILTGEEPKADDIEEEHLGADILDAIKAVSVFQ